MLFRVGENAALYAAFGDDGIPTAMADGSEACAAAATYRVALYVRRQQPTVSPFHLDVAWSLVSICGGVGMVGHKVETEEAGKAAGTA